MKQIALKKLKKKYKKKHTNTNDIKFILEKVFVKI